MNTIKETIKLVLGALLLGAAFYLIAALPGFLDDTASTVPVGAAGVAR
jgi:hypothetical protein